MPICTKASCRKNKSRAKFSKNATRPNGLQAWCKECTDTASKKRRTRNLPKPKPKPLRKPIPKPGRWFRPIGRDNLMSDDGRHVLSVKGKPHPEGVFYCTVVTEGFVYASTERIALTANKAMDKKKSDMKFDKSLWDFI